MTSNKNLGNAGEFYVLAQLAQREYIAEKIAKHKLVSEMLSA